MRKFKILAFVFLATIGFQAKAAIYGEVDYVLNSPYAVDLFSVVIKPGWTGTGCGASPNQGNAITAVFAPANNMDYKNYHRNFLMVLTAITTGAKVSLHSVSSNCSSFYAVTFFNE